MDLPENSRSSTWYLIKHYLRALSWICLTFSRKRRGTYHSHFIKDQTASTLFRSVACYWRFVKVVHQWSYYLVYVVQTLTANLHICIEGQVFNILVRIKKQIFWCEFYALEEVLSLQEKKNWQKKKFTFCCVPLVLIEEMYIWMRNLSS